jgi:hypothetical protein
MSDYDIIQAARYAKKTGDFTKIQTISENFLTYAEKRWAPHAQQDEACRKYREKLWWQKIFSKKSFGGDLGGRCRAYDDFAFAKALAEAVEKRDMRGFTNMAA